MPTVANGFVVRRCGDGVGRRHLGGGLDDVRGGLSVVCSSIGCDFYVAVRVWFLTIGSVLAYLRLGYNYRQISLGGWNICCITLLHHVLVTCLDVLGQT